jgi:Zn-dependent peptidase ImmA (M78 family)
MIAPPGLRLIDVTQSAEKFLQKYHSSLTLPIPIEEIAELQMNIAIAVVPGIKSLIGIDSFISSNFTQITIDEKVYNIYPERTRFSIAHEIGHYVLHYNWYKEYGPKNFEDYLTFHERIDPQVYKYLEIQAQTFAGLILVPTTLLLREIKKRLGKLPSLEAPEILTPISQDLLEVFQVSGEVILRRLLKEKLVKLNS